MLSRTNPSAPSNCSLTISLPHCPQAADFCSGDICEHRKGVADGPPHAISRAELADDPPWMCKLDCRGADGLNETMLALLNPPFQISNGLIRRPLGQGVSAAIS